ncbi:MAG: tetratricopeptide repeat protein [Alphaproteobacteria bacterium]|nr:tetratricopeptide repeat protein [Alphaproteobacteria bacterium]
MSYFEKCLEIDPNYTDALYNLGHILLYNAIKYDLNINVLFRIIDLSMRAYNAGEVDAAIDLGIAYSYLTEAGYAYSAECIKWCECSANNHNNAKAQLNLALFHIQGSHNLSQDKDLILNYLDRSIEQNNTQAIALKIFMLLFLDFEQYQVEINELFQCANHINLNWMQEISFVLPLFDAFNNLKTLQQNELDEEALEDLTTDPVSSEADDSSSEEDPSPAILSSSDTIEKKIHVELKNNKHINKKEKNKAVPKSESLTSKRKLKNKNSVTLSNIMNKKSRKKVRWDEFVKLAQRYMKPGDSIVTTKHKGSKVKFDIAGNKLDIDVPKHNERELLQGRRLEKVREFLENLKR